MRHKQFSLGLLVLSLGIAVFISSVPAQQLFYYANNKRQPLRMSTEKITAKFMGDMTEQEIQTFWSSVAGLDATVAPEPLGMGFMVLRVKRSTDIAVLLRHLKARSEILHVNPVYLFDSESELFVSDRVAVEFHSPPSIKELEGLITLYGIEIDNHGSAIPTVYTFRLIRDTPYGVLETANRLYEEPSTLWSEPEMWTPLQSEYTVSDTYWNEQYYLRNTGQGGGTTGIDINVSPAWDITLGSTADTVAVIDFEGVTSHADLPSSRVVTGWNAYLQSSSNTGPVGNEAHGMACAGIIAAQHNTEGIAGIAPNVKIMPIRLTYSASTVQIAAAIDTAWRWQAEVLSNSWRIGNEGYWSDAIASAIGRALNQGRGGKGCVVVKSAGNTANRSANPPNYGFITFPGTVSGVFVIGAIDRNGNIKNYSPRSSLIDVVAPSGDLAVESGGKLKLTGDVWTVDKAGDPPDSAGYNPDNAIYFSDPPRGDPYPPGNYTAHFGGTSAAAPQASGTAVLVLALNPNLEGKPTNPQVQNIIRQTATDMGASGKDNDFGYGRINAYQALLLALAYANKSISAEATSYNNGRRLIRDSNNRYHLVFESGGEIFYRRSNVGGTSWETPVRLSSGNGNNKFPSITGTNTRQFVVWQRYTGYSGGQHKYDTYFAKNTGSGWSTNTITNLSNLGFSAQSNPLPVITYCTNESGVYRQLVCARTSSGIKYVTSTTDGSSWSSATLIPDASASHQNPSLSMGPTTPQVMVYLAYDDGNNIYYNSYSGFSGNWYGSQTNISTGSGTSNNKYPSVEKDEYQYGGKNFAWQGYSPGIMADVIIHRRDTGPFKMFETGNSAARPSITGHQSSKRSLIFYDSISKYVYRAYYNGSSWSQTQVSYNGAHPNISAGTTTAKYIWTAGSSSPYSIAIGSEVLPTGGMFKVAAVDTSIIKAEQAKPIPLVYHRSAIVQDTALTSLLWAEVGEIVMTTLKGDTIPIEFVGIDADSFQATTQNVFSYLETAPVKIPGDVAT